MKVFFTKYFKYFILAALIYFPLFGNLGTTPIRLWDESRVAINSYEMLKGGDYLVPHFNGDPDMWSTKPPFLVWLQVISMKFFGINELALRLPSAFAALFICLALLIFSLKYFKQFWFGFIAILVLITSNGYISDHAVRTGDYDSLLTLFTTLGGLLFFVFMETKKNTYLYLFFLSIFLAVLTKSIAGLLFLPAIGIYLVWQKQFLNIIKNKHFYFGLTGFLILVFAYYFFREKINPGYCEAVLNNELGGRYFDVIEFHKHGFWFFFENFVDTKLSFWFYLVPCGLLIGLAHKDSKIKRITLFSFLIVFTYWLIISISETKLEWYDVPMYPFLAILVANFVFYIFEFIKDFDWFNSTLKINVLPFIFLFLIFINPYNQIFNKTYKPQKAIVEKTLYEIGYYLKDAVKGRVDVNDCFLVNDGYNSQNLFYVNLLKDKNIKFNFKEKTKLAKGDIIIVQQKEVKNFIKANFSVEFLNKKGNIEKYRILDRKP